MISPIKNNFNSIRFGQNDDREKALPYDKDTLLKNNLSTRSRITIDKVTKAFTVYPAKGLKGSINSNFYEFLTMGTVPYLIGSATLMAVFNSANKYFAPFERAKASALGNKMALGVLFYGLFKSISKSFTNIPVRLITGVDTQLPYAKVNYQLQETPEGSDLTSIEYHKVGESVDFTRWDLLYKDPKTGKQNEVFDKIAKKNGLGENLNDSDQEVKPIYKEILVKSNLARTFSSYMWAATGVALAFQKPWENFFRVATLKFWKPKDFVHSLKVFKDSFVESAKELYNGREHSFSKIERYSGKALLGLASLITLLGIINTLHITKKPSKISAKDVMDKNKESVVN